MTELFKEQPSKIDLFDRLILEEQYAEALAFAIDNNLEKEALKLCIGYIQEDDERCSIPADNGNLTIVINGSSTDINWNAVSDGILKDSIMRLERGQLEDKSIYSDSDGIPRRRE